MVIGTLVHHGLSQHGGPTGESRYPVDHVDDEVEPIHVVADQHVERRGRGAFLLVPAHVEVVVSGPTVGQPVDQRRIAVIGEDDRSVGGEDRVEFRIRQPVRVLAVRFESHQVDHVDDAYPQVGQFVSEDVGGRQYLHRGYVTGGGEYHVRVAVVVGRPRPDAEAALAVPVGVVDVEPGRLRLLAGDHDVDVVAAAQAVVDRAQQRVRVRRQVDADDLGL